MATVRHKFTAQFLNTITPPASGRDTYLDPELPGLELRHTARGIKTWSCVLRQRNGRIVRCTLGRYPAVNLRAAVRERDRLAGEASIGVDIAARDRAERRLPDLDGLFNMYATARIAAGRRGMANVRQTYERWLGTMPADSTRTKPVGAASWGGRRIDTLAYAEVDDLVTRLRARGLTGATINKIIGTLSAMYGHAKSRRVFEGESPTSGIPREREYARTRFLGSDELPKFWTALQSLPQVWQDFFALSLSVGFRRSAMASMAWKDVDLTRGTWSVPGASSKNGEPLTLVLVGDALEILNRRRLQQPLSPWVFPSAKSKKGHVTSPKLAWRKLIKSAGLEDLHIHDLRHSLASWLAMSGHSLLEIGRVLGHRDTRSASVYAHLQTDHVRAASTKANLLMFAHRKTGGDK